MANGEPLSNRRPTMTPIIQLTTDKLTFSFPEITQQLNALLDRHLDQTNRKMRLPDNRQMLTDAVIALVRNQRTDWVFRPAPVDDADAEPPKDTRPTWRRYDDPSLYEPPDDLYTAAENLTVADVEKALRKAVCLPSPTFWVSFQRTLRVPDDGKAYPLPAGFGNFPLRSVDDFAHTLPAEWVKRGGVIMPMYQSEALWIRFTSEYPFAVKIGSGKIDAVSGEPWTPALEQDPQNYVIVPEQPWLDGFSVGEGLIRQFVAMPLGDGYSVEDQLTGKGDIGGIQIQAYPMNAEVCFYENVVAAIPTTLEEIIPTIFAEYIVESGEKHRVLFGMTPRPPAMALGMGGTMRQEIFRDGNPVTAWDQTQTCRCFVHLCNSNTWRQFTHKNPPHPPISAKKYKSAGIPWFDYYRDDQIPLQGSETLAKLKSVHQLGKEQNTEPLAENTTITPDTIIQYGNARRHCDIRNFRDLP